MLALSLAQFVCAPSVHITNVTVRSGYFKAEGSLEIFQSDGLVFRLDKRGRRDECVRGLSRTQEQRFESGIQTSRYMEETRQSPLSL